jgi:hypothetical protein
VKLYEIVDIDGNSVSLVAYHNREEAEKKLVEMKKESGMQDLKVKEYDRRMDYEG